MSQRILLVDDEEAILFALSEYCTARGHEVCCARTLAEAEALLQQAAYSAVIADLSLTGSRGREGLDLVRQVRRQHPGTRVIILTAYGSAEAEQEAGRWQVSAFLQKPRPLAEVVRLVEQADATPGTACDPPEAARPQRMGLGGAVSD